MKFDVLQPDKFYPGMTRLVIAGKRALACMGTGPEVERAIREKLAQLDNVPDVRRG